MTPAWLDHVLLVSIGLLVAAIAAAPARWLLRRDPTACYRLCLALLLGALAVLPIQLLVQGMAHAKAEPVRTWLRSIAQPRPRIELAPADLTDERLLVERDRAPAHDPHFSAVPAALFVPDEEAAAPAVPAVATSGESALDLRWLRDAWSAARPWLASPWLVSIWLAGAFALALRRLLRVARTWRLLARARPVADPEVVCLWRGVAGDSEFGARVRLVESDDIESPACVGGLAPRWSRPALVLPAVDRRHLDPQVLRWALKHELVHLERGDSLVAAMQSAVTALLWFHPAAWWLSAEIGRLRELSCDQVVVRSCGKKKSYALALLEYAAAFNGNHASSDAEPHSAGATCALLHWSRSPSQIQRRIEMLTIDAGSPSRARRALGRLFALSAFFVPLLGQVGVAATFLPQAPPAVPVAPKCSGDDGSCPRQEGKDKADAERAAASEARARDAAERAKELTDLRAALDQERSRMELLRKEQAKERGAQRATAEAARLDELAELQYVDDDADARDVDGDDACDTDCDDVQDLAVELENLNVNFADAQEEAAKEIAAAQEELKTAIALQDDGTKEKLAKELADYQQKALAQSKLAIEKAMARAKRAAQYSPQVEEKVKQALEKASVEAAIASKRAADALQRAQQGLRFGAGDAPPVPRVPDDGAAKGRRMKSKAARRGAVDDPRDLGTTTCPNCPKMPQFPELPKVAPPPQPPPNAGTAWPVPVAPPTESDAPSGAPPAPRAGRKAKPFATADQDVLLERIKALEAEIAELRAELAARRGQDVEPVQEPPARKRVRSVR